MAIDLNVFLVGNFSAPFYSNIGNAVGDYSGEWLDEVKSVSIVVHRNAEEFDFDPRSVASETCSVVLLSNSDRNGEHKDLILTWEEAGYALLKSSGDIADNPNLPSDSPTTNFVEMLMKRKLVAKECHPMAGCAPGVLGGGPCPKKK